MHIVHGPDLANLPAELTQNLSWSGGTGFFQSLEWFSCLCRAGIFPVEGVALIFPESEKWGCFTLKCASGLRSLTNFYSPEYGLSGTARSREMPALVEALAESAGPAGRVELRCLKTGTTEALELIDAFVSSPLRTDVSLQSHNWFSTISVSSGEDYWQSRSSQLRNTVRRRSDKVARRHDVEIKVIRNGVELKDRIAEFQEVYATSWKPRETFPRFIPELMSLSADLGLLRLGMLYLDGQAVSSQLWLVDREVAHIYKLAHDPQFREYSVGSILTAHMFKYVIDYDAVRVIDFGVGNETYKMGWVDECREIVSLEGLNTRTARGSWLMWRRSARNLARRLVGP